MRYLIRGLLIINLILIMPAVLFGLEFTPSAVDIGGIRKGAPAVTRDIVIKNNEAKPIVIKKIRPSCECISILSNHSVTLTPNGEYVLKLSFIPKLAGSGKFKKPVFIETENSNRPFYIIYVFAQLD